MVFRYGEKRREHADHERLHSSNSPATSGLRKEKGVDRSYSPWEKRVNAERIQWKINGVPISGGREMPTSVNGEGGSLDRVRDYERA